MVLKLIFSFAFNLGFSVIVIFGLILYFPLLDDICNIIFLIIAVVHTKICIALKVLVYLSKKKVIS